MACSRGEVEGGGGSSFGAGRDGQGLGLGLDFDLGAFCGDGEYLTGFRHLMVLRFQREAHRTGAQGMGEATVSVDSVRPGEKKSDCS